MPPLGVDFDYLVLGAGSGGNASARRAAMLGAKVGIVEGGRFGGTCVNVGCVPKKVMFNTAMHAEMIHDHQDYGCVTLFGCILIQMRVEYMLKMVCIILV